MNQNEEYIELDLKALLFYAFRRWKPIVVFAVIVALLLGALMAVSEYFTGANPDETVETPSSSKTGWDSTESPCGCTSSGA